MSTELIVAGEMGKGGGSTESKDTLISEQTVKTLFVVGEGLIDSVETVYLDTVEISNFDADFEYRTGTGAQTVVDGFTVTESPLPGFTAKNIIRDSTKKNGEELPNISTGISVSITSLVKNNWYKITQLGTLIITDWTQFGAAKNEVGQVFKATKNGSGSGNGVAVQMNPVFQVPETIVSIPYEEAMKSVRASFTFSALTKTDKNGNIVGSTVVFEVYTRHNSTNGIWSLYKSKQWTVKGKTTHGYTFDLELPRPDTATSYSPWQIKVIRITPDSGTVKKQDTMQWTAVTQLYHSTLSYNNTALAAVVLRDATQFGNRIPEIMFKVKGKKIKLPNNYIPGTSQAVGTYTGNWTGTFATYLQYSNNPAWILYDVLTDTRAGLGIPEADLDKYSFYSLGKYCDEPLANGYSEPIVCRDNGEVLQEAYALTIPRFTLDYSFQTREGVKDFLSQILSICNANLITNEFGQLAVIFQQRGQVVKRVVANSNVIDGVFTYQSSNIEQRTNLVNVTYNRGLNFGRTDTVTVSEDSLITRYGLRPLDIVLPGCYHETQAIRKARWVLYSNCYFTDFITFSVLLDGMTYKIGDLIKVIDEYNRPDQFQAVITAVSTVNGLTSVTLDRTITITEGSYTFLCMNTAGNEITKTITAPAGFNSVDFSTVQSISVGTIAVVSKSTPKIYRVTSITKDEDQVYSITALEFDEAIFDYVDGTVSLSPKTGDFAGVGQFGTLPVSGIAVKENFGTNGVYASGRLQVSWQWDTEKTQKYRANFKLTYTVDDGVPTIVNTITSDTYDIMNPIPGVYTISVWAVNSFTNIYSAVATYSYSFRVTGTISTLLPPINVRIAGTTAVSPQPALLNFSTPELTLAFDYNPANQNVEDALYDYLVEIWDEAGLNLIESYSVNPITGLETVDPIDENLLYKPLNGTFALPFNRNVNIFGGTAARTFKVKVYSRYTIGDLSLPIVVTVSNPVPAFTSFTITPDFNNVRVDIAASSEIDVKEYYIWRGTTSTFTPDSTNLIYRGVGNSVSLTTTDTNSYYYKCAISDNFGNTGLIISDPKVAASIDVTVARYSYIGLQFSTNESTNVVSWSSFIAYRDNGTSDTISAGSATWSSGVLYLYYVPGNTTLQSTTNANLAVAGRILGSYKGANDITADAGKAYIDGDQIIAGSLLANALSTSTAYITNMAMIGNIIQSDNYGTNSGWRIDKNGTAKFTGLTVQSSTIDSNSTLNGTAVSTVVSNSLDAVSKGNSCNLFSNGGLSAGIGDWIVAWVEGTGTNYTVAWDLGAPDWVPAKGHCIGVVRSGTTLAASGRFDLRCTKAIPVQANKRYELTGYLASHRCYASMYIGWYKLVSGVETVISYAVFDSPSINNGGQSLNNWHRAGGFVTAPSDATYAYIHLRAGSQYGSDPYMWATNLYFGEASAAQTQLSPFTEVSYTPQNLSGTSDPTGVANTNDTYFNTTTGLMWVYKGSSWQKVMPLMTSSNVSTFIDSAAIGSAQIGNAQIETLKIAGNAVTTNTYYVGSNVNITMPANTTYGTSSNTTILSASTIYSIMPTVDITVTRVVLVTVEISYNDSTPGRFGIRFGMYIYYFDLPDRLLSSVTNQTCTAQFAVNTGPVLAANITILHWYRITSVGSTNFTSLGASANTVGVIFKATSSSGSGTGTAEEVIPNLEIELFQGSNASWSTTTSMTVTPTITIMTGKR